MLHPDAGQEVDHALATGQCWYCWCNKRFNASFGVVIEMKTLAGKICYCRAEVPPSDVLDVRAMKVERDMPNATPEEIYERMPVIPPTVTDMVRQHPSQPESSGYFHMDWEAYNTLPWFHWRDVYTLTGAPLQVKKTKAQNKADYAKASAASSSSGR